MCPEEGDLLCTVGNLAAGFGDAITFGATAKVRDLIGAGDQVDETSGAFLAGEIGGLGASIAVGSAVAQGIRSGATLATSGAARAIGTKLLTTRTGQALFGKGGAANTGRALRVGVSRAKDGGRLVFRAAGDAVEKVSGRVKIDILDLGRIEDFIRHLP